MAPLTTTTLTTTDRGILGGPVCGAGHAHLRREGPSRPTRAVPVHQRRHRPRHAFSVGWAHGFPVFVEPQQGALRRSTRCRQSGTKRWATGVLPVRPLRGHERCRPAGGRRTPAVTSVRWLARSRPSGWHHGHLGDLPAPRSAGHLSWAQVDEMSGGRVDFGIGAGWFEQEHAAYAIPFLAPGRAVVRPAHRTTEILTGLWTTPPADHDFAGRTTPSPRRPHRPNPRRIRIRRSSSAARAPSGPRRWR